MGKLIDSQSLAYITLMHNLQLDSQVDTGVNRAMVIVMAVARRIGNRKIVTTV